MDCQRIGLKAFLRWALDDPLARVFCKCCNPKDLDSTVSLLFLTFMGGVISVRSKELILDVVFPEKGIRRNPPGDNPPRESRLPSMSKLEGPCPYCMEGGSVNYEFQIGSCKQRHRTNPRTLGGCAYTKTWNGEGFPRVSQPNRGDSSLRESARASSSTRRDGRILRHDRSRGRARLRCGVLVEERRV